MVFRCCFFFAPFSAKTILPRNTVQGFHQWCTRRGSRSIMKRKRGKIVINWIPVFVDLRNFGSWEVVSQRYRMLLGFFLSHRLYTIITGSLGVSFLVKTARKIVASPSCRPEGRPPVTFAILAHQIGLATGQFSETRLLRRMLIYFFPSFFRWTLGPSARGKRIPRVTHIGQAKGLVHCLIGIGGIN